MSRVVRTVRTDGRGVYDKKRFALSRFHRYERLNLTYIRYVNIYLYKLTAFLFSMLCWTADLILAHLNTRNVPFHIRSYRKLRTFHEKMNRLRQSKNQYPVVDTKY